MFLPVLTGPQVPAAYINLFWGSIYGLGFLLVAQLGHFNPGPVALSLAIFGMLIWPLAVTYALYRGFRSLFARQTRWVALGLGIFSATLAYNVQIASVRGTYVYYLPIFSAFLEI